MRALFIIVGLEATLTAQRALLKKRKLSSGGDSGGRQCTIGAHYHDRLDIWPGLRLPHAIEQALKHCEMGKEGARAVKWASVRRVSERRHCGCKSHMHPVVLTIGVQRVNRRVMQRDHRHALVYFQRRMRRHCEVCKHTERRCERESSLFWLLGRADVRTGSTACKHADEAVNAKFESVTAICFPDNVSDT